MTGSAVQGLGDTLKARVAVVGARPRSLKLAEVSQQKLTAELPGASTPGVPRKIGFPREVASLATPAATAAQLDWQVQPDGRRIANLSLTSPAAKGIRLGLRVQSLPPESTLRVYAPGASLAQEMKGSDILLTLQRNATIDSSEDAGVYWTPLVEGAETTLEIEVPAAASVAQVVLAVPRISHLFDSVQSAPPTAAPAASQAKIGEAASCEVDVNCQSAYATDSNSVARMIFVKSGTSYLCTGTLLNDTAGSGIPYFLGANHCISTQTAASTLQTFWFYRSSSCNSGSLTSAYRTLTTGATLLYANSNNDTSFMRLNSAPPSGAVYAGWSSDVPVINAPVFNIHHPEGDLQKISFGSIASFQSCTATGDGEFSCTDGSVGASNFVDVTLTTGTTEGGSSGSPLYRTINGVHYVTGQLWGGSASCQQRNGSNVYSRFDQVHSAALKNWLGSPSAGPTTTTAPVTPVTPVTGRSAIYRFYNTSTGAHFFTISTAERDNVIATLPQFRYEGPVFYAYGQAGTGLSPVYRFYNSQTNAHFFTVSAAERDNIIATLKQFSYEGTAWYARTSEGDGSTALYRFFRTSINAHFYTADLGERNYVINSLPDFRYEGIAYYVWNSL